MKALGILIAAAYVQALEQHQWDLDQMLARGMRSGR